MTQLLSYDARGTGPGLVLIHGTSSNGLGSWGTVLDGLAAENTVILPDLPGSGETPLPDGPLDLDTLADQIIATARAAGLERFAVAGASAGAPVAVRVAARYPDRISRLATVVGYASPRPVLRLNLELWAAMRARGDEDTGKFLTMLSFSDQFLATLTDEQMARIVRLAGADPAPGTAAQIDFALELDVHDDLPAIQVPTLILTCTGDRFVPPGHSYELAAGIPGAHLIEIDGGHASMFEDPPRTLSVLQEFLGGVFP
jgi:pimeloyl-ACP methyl ester carboxylesterase